MQLREKDRSVCCDNPVCMLAAVAVGRSAVNDAIHINWAGATSQLVTRECKCSTDELHALHRQIGGSHVRGRDTASSVLV